ncbi:dipeptide/oligopeptide/nickel ABC transporter ATP-binding protein [Streptomyces spinoverrucosus]|uniref:Dipeptide/oligopeptide/nickel ABC transporter ATP-binding protein n=2 Tax=Streptomyces spinoverrucosus TaxID=284043 RepID=A0A4Y3VFW9_9ACTN|nr:ABC transporter ATP-binding protein [Streptomyces spinoverrucosus]GEC05125.1 dipeptide/oligopeptide/nickel ABC transporter ATP-binding protein [Streptomyces spinoverrucosus]GHB72018.1 dipeptide/oligopeptide/nickel ABC transporter ATP-binding protein [Streptomyces spinoverrucosus]
MSQPTKESPESQPMEGSPESPHAQPRPLAVSTATPAFLDVRDLRVHFPTEDGVVRSVDGVSFTLDKGRTLGIVGESGSGKSVTSLALLGLHKGTRALVSGEVWLDGRELVALPEKEMRQLRGSTVSMIFQDPLSALHPFFTVGAQIAEAYRVHHQVSRKEANDRAVEMLQRVGIPQPRRRAKDYPHQFSGGMRQRAMIAMSLVCDPALLIADEPTTALDVTVQAQILDLIGDLQQEFGSAVVIITHDLGVVAGVADDILVMYGGRRIEYGTVRDVLKRPQHPYTWGLLQSMPHIAGDVDRRLNPIPGSPPSLINLPGGCAFHPRCPHKGQVPDGRCSLERPELVPVPGTAEHIAACHLVADIRGGENTRAAQ